MRVSPDEFACPGVDHLLVVVDKHFPLTEPRICAPQADRDFAWPHVEGGGLLCLKQTRCDADAGERVLAQLTWARDLLRLDETERGRDFAREFGAYWAQRLSPGAPTFVSLSSPAPPSREVWFYNDWPNKRLVVADERRALLEWLRNSGDEPSSADIKPSYLVCLDRPWRPSEFPNAGRDILGLVPRAAQEEILEPGEVVPLLIGTDTETGPVFAGILLTSAKESVLRKGFRSGTTLPFERVTGSFSAFPVKRCSADRVDGAWVHGRDHNADYSLLSRKKVAIVGCGSLGGFLVRLLAQAGVGRFVLVDNDKLAAHNVSRHVLGLDQRGEHKAKAIGEMLVRDFPHMANPVVYTKRIEDLREPELAELASADLVISAGIDYQGECFSTAGGGSVSAAAACLRMARRVCPRRACRRPCRRQFSRRGFHAGWRSGVHADRSMAGWGAPRRGGVRQRLQPHGAVDLQSSVTLAARLALDVLRGRVAQSCRRTWQGDRNAVITLGGTPRAEFAESFVEKNYAWP